MLLPLPLRLRFVFFCIRPGLVAAIELYFDAHLLSWSILEWLWGTGIEHQPGPIDQAPQHLDDLHAPVQAYRPSYDTFAPGPATSGYDSSRLPDNL